MCRYATRTEGRKNEREMEKVEMEMESSHCPEMSKC
jgi:hypothetical protein